MKTTLAILLVCAGVNTLHALTYDGFGLDPSKEMYQYSHRVWQKKDGLPQNSVHAITQTRDGYLWFATDEGLARFDGMQFTVFNTRNTPAFVNNQVRSLCEAADGTLWIGFMEGGVVSLKDGAFVRFVKEPSIVKATIWNIFRDHAQTLWFCSAQGLLHFIPSDSSHVLYGEAAGLPARNVLSVAEDTTGTLMAGTRLGIASFHSGRFEPHPTVKYPARHLALDAAGAMWFIANNKTVARINSDNTVTEYGAGAWSKQAMVNTFFHDPAGTLWIGTDVNGLYRYSMGKFSSFTLADGLSGLSVESVFEDREGNLWIGTTSGGVNRFSSTKFTTYLPTAGPPMVWSMYQDRTGTLWGGSEGGMLLRLEKGKFVPAFTKAPFMTATCAAILLDRTNVLWVGSRAGLYRIPHWRTPVLTKADYRYFDVGAVSALTEDSKGTVWIGGTKGLTSYRNGTLKTYAKELLSEHDAKLQKYAKEGSAAFDIRVVYEDRRGDLWLCIPPQGVVRMHDGKFFAFDSSQGMPSLHVMCMREDAEGMYWFGTLNGGLVRWNGEKFSKLSYEQNLFDASVFSIQEDRLGNLWMSSNNGVCRVPKNELNDAADGKIKSIRYDAYTMSDGMRSDECNGGYQNSGVTAQDGTLWFPTTVGIVRVDPQTMPKNTVPPPVVIESFSADKKIITPDSGVEIDPGAGELDFTYAGLSFMSSDRVRFRVQLEGFDPDWVTVGTRRYVSYTNIPPGHYVFRVCAANSDGVWNEAGASFGFVLRPHFYQTIWFYLSCFIAVAFSGAVVHKVYRRSKDRALIASRRQAQLEARLRESQLHSLSMQLQPHFLFNTLNSISSLMHFDVERADGMIAHLGQLLRMSLDRMKRQEVPLQQELEFLESFLCIEQSRLGERLTIIRNIDDAALTALVPSMVWQPLVENAIKHGIAPRKSGGVLTLGARRVDSKLELTIQDNGEGMGRISPKSSNGVGIRNTMDRLELLYPHRHEIRFSNSPGGGVTVTLRIPFRNEEYETDEHPEEGRTAAPRYTY